MSFIANPDGVADWKPITSEGNVIFVIRRDEFTELLNDF